MNLKLNNHEYKLNIIKILYDKKIFQSFILNIRQIKIDTIVYKNVYNLDINL